LCGWHAEPVAVGEGPVALGALWRAAASGRAHGLVLLDARLNGGDGLALAAKVRQAPAAHAKPLEMMQRLSRLLNDLSVEELRRQAGPPRGVRGARRGAVSARGRKS
jgi:hypothetical protein